MVVNIIIFLGLVLLVLMASAKKRADYVMLRRRVERIRRRNSAVPTSVQELSLRRKKNETQGAVQQLLNLLPNSKRMAVILERAGVQTSPQHYMMICFVVMLVVIVVAPLTGKVPMAAAVPLALMLGVLLPFKWLKRRIAKRSQVFLSSFPDAIDLIVRGLRSGLPVAESIVQVANELPQPVSGVFMNVSQTMKLGVPLEKALVETAKKLELQEFYFFTTSIILQRETGGNLSEILNNLSDVLRSRFMMKMKIHAITSEARASAMIIGALPFVVAAAISVLSPNYLRPLIDESGGHTALEVAAGMLGFGIWAMRRMARFEI